MMADAPIPGAEEIDVQTEGAILSSVLAEGFDVDPRVWDLTPEDFFSADNGWIWRAVLECREAGLPLDHITVASRLREWGRWDQVFGSYVDSLRSNPVTIHAGAYADILRKRSRVRKLGHVLNGLGAEALHAKIPDLDKWLSRAREQLEATRPNGGAFEIVTGNALDVRLPPRAWLIRDLAIKPGPITLYAGSSDSAKTLTLQSLAVTVATGRGLVWGKFPAERGRVLHVDYEQGSDLTLFRYQRLALSLGVWSELWANLAIETSAKKPYLDSGASLAELERLVRAGNYRVCIIDSLRAAFPSLDENDSSARQWLDRLKPISEATGCTFIVIHHARKPTKDEQGGAQASVRGSGALYEAAQQVIVLRKESDDLDAPIIVRPNKGRLGKRAGRFLVRIADIPIPVEALDPHVAEQTNSEDIANETGSLRYALDVSVMAENVAKVADDVDRMAEEILRIVRRYQGIGVRDLKAECRVNSTKHGIFLAARKRLIDGQLIEIRMRGQKEGHYPALPSSDEDEDASCQ